MVSGSDSPAQLLSQGGQGRAAQRLQRTDILSNVQCPYVQHIEYTLFFLKERHFWAEVFKRGRDSY